MKEKTCRKLAKIINKWGEKNRLFFQHDEEESVRILKMIIGRLSEYEKEERKRMRGENG